ncbi:MAG: hypothetical protein ACE5MB_03850 [Anaerolineae bacterium]
MKELIEDYTVDVEFPDVSGFEILEMLDLRSEIAERERELNDEERTILEEADRRFLQNAPLFYASLAAVADLAEMRRRAGAPPSHWWWYPDELVRVAA